MESSSLVTVRSLTMVNVQQAGSPKQLPEGKTSIFWAIFLVVNAALGAGLLAFPLSFYMTGGIIQGIMIELVLISFVIGGVLILVYSADITQSATYEDTVEAVCGPKVKFFAELCLVAFCFGSNTAYLVVIGDQLQDITNAFKYHGYPLSHYWWMDRRFLITSVSLVFILPMLFFRRIGILSYASFLSVLCCFYITIMIMVRYFHHYSDSCGKVEGIPNVCSRSVSDAIIAIPFICFGYQCHVSSVPVYADMKQRSFKSFIAVIVPSVLICFCVYTFTGVFGYLRFYPNYCIVSDILRNFCPKDIPIDVARGLLALVIITSYPILAFCGRTALDSILMKVWDLRRVRIRINIPSSPSKNVYYSSNVHEETSSRSCLYEGIRLRVESVTWFLISLLLAIFVPQISYIINLTGGLAASFIFLFPGFILIKLVLKPQNYSDYSTLCRGFSIVFGSLIIVIGTFIFGLSVVYTIMKDANLF